MIERAERDGQISVERLQADHKEAPGILIRAQDKEWSQSIMCSEYNARRLLAALAAVLDVPLARTLSRAAR